jgi:hypothetical protein
MDVIVKRIPEFDVRLALNIKVIQGLIGRIVAQFPVNAVEVDFPPFGKAIIPAVWVAPLAEQPDPMLERVFAERALRIKKMEKIDALVSKEANK